MVSLNDDFADFAAFAFAYGTFRRDTIPGTQPHIPNPPTEYGPAQELVTELAAARDEKIRDLPAA